MGSRHFQTHILYYHYLGMTYTSKIITPDGSRSKHIIIKVLNYVIGDFKGPIRRKTYSLLCNEIVSSYYFFFLLDFSKMPGRIFMKFSGMVYIGLERSKIIFRLFFFRISFYLSIFCYKLLKQN